MTKIQPPRLPKGLPAETLTQLEDHQEYAAIAVSGCDLTGQSASGVLFEEVSLKSTGFTGSRLPGLRLLDARLSGCDLSGAFLEEARFRRVEFTGCRLLGVQLASVQLDDVRFKDCNLEGAVFVASQAKALHFDNCMLRAVTFEGANLDGAIFRDCDLTNADLRNASLKQADLRRSKLDELGVFPQDMQRAIISPAQAVQVAGLLGVTVMDEEL
jgi:uncharacterized protein YjbI with pentapeptide repeats